MPVQQSPVTKKTHSNPCFWTALWNEQYYENYVRGGKLKARDQKVFSLNLKANKILQLPVEEIHYDKWMGAVRYTPEELKEMASKTFAPAEYNEYVELMEGHEYPAYLDFENKWNFAEQNLGYPTLMNVVKNQTIASNDTKQQLMSFLLMQNIRSHAVMSMMIEKVTAGGLTKLDYFVWIDKVISDYEFLESVWVPHLSSQWHLYISHEHSLPLPDTPIFLGKSTLMVALSPRMLLEIDRKKPMRIDPIEMHDGIPPGKLSEYRTRCIANTYKEIIFSDEETLAGWQETVEFRNRTELAQKVSLVNRELGRAGIEVLRLNALGKMPSRRARRRKTSHGQVNR